MSWNSGTKRAAALLADVDLGTGRGVLRVIGDVVVLHGSQLGARAQALHG